ncbi:cytochrome c oxidase subunit II [Nocardioides sp.]|uniref:aa3-type cytochrome oxidase subunit II n=1 Tax=Nocardioides sp. TaxID=35761 RepID=UPI0026242479|nr:cytochrome c oxidase subunit II [Nocardioides sp.]
MSLQLPERSASLPRRARRITLLGLLGVALLALSACGSDTELERLAMPKPVTVEGESTLELWQGAWIAALLTGVIVWGLIFYAIIKFRRRSDDEVPIQTRYNLPLEIFYTIFPIIMVIVFFSHTIRVQNIVLNDEDVVPDQTVYVVGQQWSWTFNYPEAVDGKNVYESGDGAVNPIPTLVLPVGQTTRFELRSPDVIHDFGVPGFLIKMDIIPGQENYFQVTPKVEGTYAGKCYELCGVYHSRMLFNVDIVSPEEYEQYLQDQYDAGFFTDTPVCGGQYARTQVAQDDEDAVIEEACQ